MATSDPRLDLRTMGHVLRQSKASFLSSLPPLLLVSLLLLSFRSALHFGALHLTALVDRDPSVRSLLSRLSDPAAASSFPSSSSADLHPPRRRRPPFLHLTRVGTLDDNFFSDSDSDAASSADRRSSRHPSFNSTFPLRLGFPTSLNPSKIRVLEFSSSPVLFSFPDDETGRKEEEEEEESDRAVELRISARGADLDRRDVTVILYLLSLLSSAQALAILGFLVSYSCALGVVFVAITGSLLGRQNSLFWVVYSGSRWGIRRLSVFVFLRWAGRDTLTQLLCILFFSDVQDQNLMFKLFINVKLMPFSLIAPAPLNLWSGLHGVDLSGFLFVWALIDTMFSVIFAVDWWVVIMDHSGRRRGWDVVREGCYLVSLMLIQAFWIKLLEMVVCGNMGRWAFSMVGGTVFAMVFQSVAEVYFMVVWLMFYFAARCKDGELEGRRFSLRDLEDSIDGLR